jgi:TP901 family phage tail tape measure protein
MATSFFVVMRMTEQISRPLRRMADAANVMGGAAGRLSNEFAALNGIFVGFAATVVTATGATVVSATKLEDALARLETVTSSTTKTMDTALLDATDSARRFSTQYTASITEFLDAQFEIGTAGIPVKEQIEATSSAFLLAKATVGDFTNAAQLLGSFLNTFGKTAEFNYLNPAEKMEAITDRLSVAVQKFQVTLPVLAESFKFITGPASTLNLNYAEMNAALGLLNTAGFRGTLAGTALSNMFNKLDRAVDKLNLDPTKFTDLNGELTSLAAFLDEVNRALGDKTSLEQQNILVDVFDIRAGRVIKTLLGNVDALKRFSSELDVSSGATKRMADIIENTASAKFTKLVHTISATAMILGQNLLPLIGWVSEKLTFLIDVIGRWMTRNGTVIATILSVSAALLGLGTAVAATYFIISRISTGLTALIAGSETLTRIVRPLVVVYGFLSNVFRAIAVSVVLFTRLLYAAILRMVTATTVTILFASSLVALMSAFTVVGVVGLLAFGLYKLVESIAATEVEFAKSREELDMMNRSYGSTLEMTARVANEVNKLGKTLRDNVNIPLLPDMKLGELPFAEDATRMMRENPAMNRVDAISKAMEEAGGMSGVVRQIARVLGEGERATLDFINSIIEIKTATDVTFAALNPLDQIFKALEGKIHGIEMAIHALSGGNEAGAESIKVLTHNFNLLNREMTDMSRAKLLGQSFEAITANIDNLRGSSSQAIKDLVKFFDQAAALGERSGEFKFAEIFDGQEMGWFSDGLVELNANSESFRKIASTWGFPIDSAKDGVEQLVSEISSLAAGAAKLDASLIGMKTSIRQVETITKSIGTQFKLAEFGTGDFIRAQENAAKKLAESEAGLQRISIAADFLRKSIESIESVENNPLINEEKFKEAKKFLEDLQEIEFQARVQINDAQVATEANKIKALIEKINGSFLSKQTQDDLKTLTESFGQVVNKALSGEVKGQAVFKNLRTAFQTQFIAAIQDDMSQLLANAFTEDFRKAVDSARGVIQDAGLGGTLFEGIESGDIFGQILKRAEEVSPKLKKLLDGVFNSGDGDKLAETFEKTLIESTVALTTAGAETASYLQVLQSVLQEGPGKNIAQIDQQIENVTRLLKDAGTFGGNDAVRPFEEILTALLTARKQFEGNTGATAAQELRGATLAATGAINQSLTLLAEVIARLDPAGKSFAEALRQSFSDGVQNIKIGDFASQLKEQIESGMIAGEDSLSSTASLLMDLIKSTSALGDQVGVKGLQDALQVALEKLNDPASFSEMLTAADLSAQKISSAGDGIKNAAGGIGAALDGAKAALGTDLINNAAEVLKPQKLVDETSIAAVQQMASGFETLRQSIVETAASIVAPITAASNELRSAATAFAESVSSIVPAANTFKTIISEAIEKFTKSELPENLAALIENFGVSSRGDTSINIKTEGGELNVSVESTGSATGTLDDQDVRAILRDTRVELMRDVDEKINRLENELRRR